VQGAQQQHKDQFVAGKTGHSGDGEAAQAGGDAGRCIAKAQQAVTGEADDESDAESQRVGQFRPHQVLHQCEHDQVRQRRCAANREKPEG